MLAEKTLDLIDRTFRADNGDKYRERLRHAIMKAEDAYRPQGAPFRGHLGASLIGRECGRELWLSFRWATKPTFDGRMQRLFNRGHLEEARFVAILESIGCEVWQHDEYGKQFRVSGHKGHFGGSMDSVLRGIPEMPDEPMVGEFKTHGDKSFKKLLEDGVKIAKFEHFVQMQIYMGSLGLRYALYLAVNKNDDTLHAEIIAFDDGIYQRYMERAAMLIDSVSPPPRINESPGWYKCKFCSQLNACHGIEEPERNCRTCRWSTPVDDSVWICEIHETRPMSLTEEMQLDGCPSYAEHPDIRGRQ